MKKLLITGANGFLGSHLVKHFLKKGDEIFAISLHTEKLTDVMDKIQFAACPTNNITTLSNRIHEFNPDVIIHCAWTGGNSYLQATQSFQFYKNLPGLADLMEIMRQNNFPHFVGIGTGAEYGSHTKLITEPVVERPETMYGVCKLMAKQYTQRFCEDNNIKWTWVRPFYTYGPDDVQTRIIPKVIMKCLYKQSIDLTDCETIVDYLYVSDFCRAIEFLVYDHKSGIFNVCSGQSYTVKAILDKIGEATDNLENLKYGVIPNRENQPTHVVGSNRKLEIATEWHPLVGLNEGLTKTIEFYKNL